jgi:LPXTG-motif cell wall-anchored protein
MGLAKALDLRESIFMIPVAAGLTLIVIRGALLAKRRRKAPDTNNGV